MDICLHPLQGEGLVHDAGIHDSLSEYLIRGEESKGAELERLVDVSVLLRCIGLLETYPILDRHSYKTITILIDNVCKILLAATCSIAA